MRKDWQQEVAQEFDVIFKPFRQFTHEEASKQDQGKPFQAKVEIVQHYKKISSYFLRYVQTSYEDKKTTNVFSLFSVMILRTAKAGFLVSVKVQGGQTSWATRFVLHDFPTFYF